MIRCETTWVRLLLLKEHQFVAILLRAFQLLYLIASGGENKGLVVLWDSPVCEVYSSAASLERFLIITIAYSI